jgi:hypothetical protein
MPPLRVLCFGNSLTAGYYHYGIDHHSYAIQLKDRLDTFVSSRTTEVTTTAQRADDAVSVDVDGLSGDLVITPPGRFRKRMEQRCKFFFFFFSFSSSISSSRMKQKRKEILR